MIIYRTFIKSYNKLVKYRKYCIFLENMVYIVNKMIFLFDLNVFNKNTKFLKKVKIPSRQTALVIISEHYCP